METQNTFEWIKDSQGNILGVSANYCVTVSEARKRWPESFAKFEASLKESSPHQEEGNG